MCVCVQVQALVAQRGGDLAEDILPALHTAAGLDWQAKARFLLLMTDAPCHGSDCHNLASGQDSYPQVSTNRIYWQLHMTVWMRRH